MIDHLRSAMMLLGWTVLLAALSCSSGDTVPDGKTQVHGRAAMDNSSSTPEIVFGVDGATREALKAAMLEMDELEASAFANEDGSHLNRRATGAYLWGLLQQIDYYYLRGVRKQSTLISADFTAFRRTESGRIEVDVLEIWDRRFFDRDGHLVSEALGRPLPQTAVFVQDDGQWKIANLEFHVSPDEKTPPV